MLVRIKAFLSFLAVLAVSGLISSPVAFGQAPSPAGARQPRAELALDYTYLRSNAPPGGCGCFNLNGGSATFAWSFKPALALVGDVTVAHSGAASSNGDDLTLSAYTAGIRYSKRLGQSPFKAFGQVLAGAAHASGSLAEGSNPAATNAGAAFAANVGGGLDLKLNRMLSLRLIDANYLVTTFDNGSNDHQNNLRLSAGVVLHF